MINKSKQVSRLPATSNTAKISLLLKPNKDPTLPSSYWPISLINVDTKIIAKALALRLEKVIPSIIHPDQTGFVKGRLASNTTRRLLNIMYHSTIQKNNTTIVTLDTEKAFDSQLEIPILHIRQVWLGVFIHKLGQTIVHLTVSHYHHQWTDLTKLHLHRGTRQGCALSPLLLTIFIEPLAAAIHQNTLIKGIRTENVHHKISLYADDILLFLQDPLISLQETIKVINSFANISDYTINWD